MPPTLDVKSAFRDAVWPALPDDANAGMLALQYQYEETERWAAEEIEALQLRQLEHLLAFADRAVPYWHERLRRAGLRAGQKLTRAHWSRLPILTRAAALAAGVKLRAPQVPQGHGTIVAGVSAGMPENFVASGVSRFFQSSITLRHALWHDMARGEKIAIIQPGPAHAPPGPPATGRDWGEGFAAFTTGPAVILDARHPAAAQLAWLMAENPAYLMTNAANVLQLAAQAGSPAQGPPGLRAIHTEAGPQTEAARAACRAQFNLPLIATLIAPETGFLALQCPEGSAHALSECAKIEILNDRSQPCAVGETGRLIATPLHNFAMPLLRCDTGLEARLGPPCPCGRTLPVLTHVRDRAALPAGA